MNVVWIAAVALMVFLEKTIRGGQLLGRAIGIGLVAWDLGSLLVTWA